MDKISYIQLNIFFIKFNEKYSFSQIRVNPHFHKGKSVNVFAMCLCHHVKCIAHALATISSNMNWKVSIYFTYLLVISL
jgi:hypothetical protein